MEELLREATDVGGGYCAVTVAQYDAETGVLVVDQAAMGPDGAGEAQPLPVPEPRRIVDTVHGRDQALHYASAQAEHWVGIVRGSVASA